MNNNNSLFSEKILDPKGMTVKNIRIIEEGENIFVSEAPDRISVVISLDFGTIYVIRPTKGEVIRAALAESDPGTLQAEEILPAEKAGTEYNEKKEFMIVPNKRGLYLVLEARPEDIVVGRSTILLGQDTDDIWLAFEEQPAFDGSKGAFADWRYTSGEVFTKLYDPLCNTYPDYVEKQSIGYDQSGKYEMFAYLFTPKNPQKTLILTGGMHGDEIDGYLGLARLLTLIAEEDGTVPGLHYLRTKVRLVVIPVINVWSVSEGKIRYNSEGVDLNRDFGEHTQAETVNVLRFVEQHKENASTLIDFHCCNSEEIDLYYQFSIQAPNAPACLKTVNHVYEDLKQRGEAQDPTDLHLIPGKYEKSDKFLQGYVWNHFGVPTLVAEHLQVRFGLHSSRSASMAVTYYGNCLLQNAMDWKN